ncbi:MAG: DUF5013 domain-containing protein [Sphingobacteriaceae bacterium]|nr:DUF5013 domain-containing protein [Sphingobacteriaceae bacterium]
MNLKLVLISGIALMCGTSCNELESFQQADLPKVAVSIKSTGGMVTLPAAGNHIKTLETITLPIKLELNGPAPSVFSVGISTDADTINNLITAGTLANTVALPTNTFSLPGSAEFVFGATDASVNLVVSLSAVERYFGKDLALAVKLTTANKGNTVNAGGKSLIVIIKTTELMAAIDVHKTSFTQGGTTVVVPTGVNFAKDNNDVIYTLGLSLTGRPELSHTVTLASNQDTIRQLIANNALTNTVAVSEGFYFPGTVTFNGTTNTQTVELKASIYTLQQYYPKDIAVAVKLSGTSRYMLDESKRTVIVVFKSSKLVEKDWTSVYLKNYTRPFVASSMETVTLPAVARWGKLAEWTTNAAANNRTGGFGSFDATNSTNIAMESTASNQINNGKIYQTITLPAGKYRLEANVRSSSGVTTSQPAYVVVSTGNIIPDATAVAGTLGSVLLNSTGVKTVTFTLNSTTTLSLGFVAKFTGTQSVNIQDVKLWQIIP